MAADPRVWLVLPTYNEADNIEAAVAAIREHLPEPRRILIVDDDSPDGTGAIADRLAAAHDDVEVLHRGRKEGIGPAYVAGFRRALAGGAELLVQMDADLSHDPADIPRLLAPLEAGEADVVLGSRYVPGGGVERWGPLRRLISRAGSAYARKILGVSVADLTGGFKAFRREALEAVRPSEAAAHGYAFQVETTYRALRAGLRVTEVPIMFRERRVGQSKMTGRIVLEAAVRVPMMRRAKAPR